MAGGDGEQHDEAELRERFASRDAGASGAGVDAEGAGAQPGPLGATGEGPDGALRAPFRRRQRLEDIRSIGDALVVEGFDPFDAGGGVQMLVIPAVLSLRRILRRLLQMQFQPIQFADGVEPPQGSPKVKPSASRQYATARGRSSTRSCGASKVTRGFTAVAVMRVPLCRITIDYLDRQCIVHRQRRQEYPRSGPKKALLPARKIA